MPAVLLGVSSAAIAFAFHETADRPLSWSLLPILAAVLSWAGSFASGVLYSRAYAMGIKGNLGLNYAEKAGLAEGRERAKEMFDRWNERAGRRYARQQWLLLLGAVLYLGGHVWLIVEQAQAPTEAKLAASVEHTEKRSAATAPPRQPPRPEQGSGSSPQ